MANFKKMDDHDFVFVNRPLTPREDKEFSDFLKARKSKLYVNRIHQINQPKKKAA